MDIIGILNEYIKNNKTEEQLASEFKTLLNKGYSIEKISKQYNVTPQQIKELLDKAQTTLNYNGIDFKQDNSGNNQKKTNQTSKLDNNLLYSESKPDKSKELSNSLDLVVDVINDGVLLEQVAKEYNISPTKLKDLLAFNGFRYYSFMNYWTKMSKEELCEYLVKELNQGFSPYDLSRKYVKDNFDRITFVKNLEQYLKKYNYKYNLTKKIWSKPTPKLSTIVKELNKGVSMKDVVESFNITTINLRQELKNNKYRFDRVFNIWTQDQRSELVKNLADELISGKITVRDLKERNLNTGLLEVELQFGGFDLNLSDKDNPLIKSNNQFHSAIEHVDDENERNMVDVLNTNATQKDDVLEKKSSPYKQINKPVSATSTDIFNNEELTCLKEMIDQWEQRKNQKLQISSDSTEISIYIKKNLLFQLNKAAEHEGVSRSLLIEKALNVYLKN
ncbi:ribbon-helix-helix domain-containing protein [Neobacillus sp. M.A.Huq-85]